MARPHAQRESVWPSVDAQLGGGGGRGGAQLPRCPAGHSPPSSFKRTALPYASWPLQSKKEKKDKKKDKKDKKHKKKHKRDGSASSSDSEREREAAPSRPRWAAATCTCTCQAGI